MNDTQKAGSPVLTENWGIWCTVAGGVTGFRQAWLKKDGVIRRFHTDIPAIVLAKKLTADHRGGTTQFTYEAREISL